VKRSPLRRGKPLERRTALARSRKPIPQMSARRRSELPAREECRQQVLERDGYRCLFPGCGSTEHLEVHEVRGGPDRAKTYLTVSACRTLCHAHNGWVHDHPEEAHALGLWRWSWE
jgi:hypothetical protein